MIMTQTKFLFTYFSKCFDDFYVDFWLKYDLRNWAQIGRCSKKSLLLFGKKGGANEDGFRCIIEKF